LPNFCTKSFFFLLKHSCMQNQSIYQTNHYLHPRHTKKCSRLMLKTNLQRPVFS
jgi:hypothetical protein